MAFAEFPAYGGKVSRIYNELKKAQRHKEAARKPAPAASGGERRSEQRMRKRVSVSVYGYAARNSPFLEPAETVDVSSGGCLLEMARNVYQGQKLLLMNTENGREAECEVVGIALLEKTGTRVAVRFTRPAPDFWKDS